MDSARPETESDTRAAATLPLLLAVLASCASYEPRALDAAAHRAAWHGRSLEGGFSGELLERLDDRSRALAAEYDPSDGLGLREAQLVALVFNPTLRLARLGVGRANAALEHAGRWADPTLSANLLRVTQSVPDPWVITPGLAFSIPLSGRLAAARDLAGAQQRAAEAALLEAEWGVWRDVQQAWFEWSAARLRVEVTERLVDAMEGLVRTTADLAERGELQRTEAALFRIEELERRNQLRRLVGEVDAREQGLRALLGLAPDVPVELVPLLTLPGEGAGEALDPGAIELCHPSLARLRQAYEVSEQRLRLEVRKQYPDLSLGPLFESDAGQSRVGLFGGLPLPFLNANRRAIAVARAQREFARASLESTYETLVGRLAAATARAQSLARQRADMERTLVPLVERQLEDAFELLRLGEGTTLVLLESLRHALQTRLDLIETRAAEALARTEAAYLIGPQAAEEPPRAVRRNP